MEDFEWDQRQEYLVLLQKLVIRNNVAVQMEDAGLIAQTQQGERARVVGCAD